MTTGRTFSTYGDFIRCGGKPRFLRPYKPYTMTLYPKIHYKPGVALQATAGKSPWIDMSYLKADIYFPNSIQYYMMLSTACKIECQVSYTYQFRGLRNGQAYAKSEEISANDSQNNDNFEMLNCN